MALFQYFWRFTQICNIWTKNCFCHCFWTILTAELPETITKQFCVHTCCKFFANLCKFLEILEQCYGSVSYSFSCTCLFFQRIRNQKSCSIWVFTNWSICEPTLTIEPIYIECAWVQKYTVERSSKASGKFWSVWNRSAIAIIHVGLFCLFNVNTYPEIATFFSSMCYLLVKKCVEPFVLPIPWSILALPL